VQITIIKTEGVLFDFFTILGEKFLACLGYNLATLYFNSQLEVVMGLGQKNLTWLGSIFISSSRVSHLWFGFGLGKFPPKNVKFFNFFLFGSKKISSKSTELTGRLTSYFLRVKSMLRSGQGPSLVGSPWSLFHGKPYSHLLFRAHCLHHVKTS